MATVHKFQTPLGAVPAWSQASLDFVERLIKHGAEPDDIRGILGALLVRLWCGDPKLTRAQLHEGLDHIWDRVVRLECDACGAMAGFSRDNVDITTNGATDVTCACGGPMWVSER